MDLCERLQRRFPYIDFRRFVEQAASARGRDVEIMSAALNFRPTEFDAALVSWVARPRLYWKDWDVDWPANAQIHQTREREVVWWPPVRGACSDWLKQGSRWHGEAENRTDHSELSCAGFQGSVHPHNHTGSTAATRRSSPDGEPAASLHLQRSSGTPTAFMMPQEVFGRARYTSASSFWDFRRTTPWLR